MPRDEIFIGTKVWASDYGFERIRHAFDKAAGKLGGITFYPGWGGYPASTLDDATIAATHGKSPAQMILRWHIQEGRQVIPKSTKPPPSR